MSTCTNPRVQGRRGVLVSTLLALLLSLPALGATVDSIPRPAPGSWSVDTTGTLRPETLAEVNRLGTNVDASGQGQLAVVMVDSTEGVQPRAFATDLFNLWGIGHEDRDDGVLLFVAMSDRKVEIVLGDGVDSAADTERSDALMARILPLFKAGDPDGAVLEGTRGMETLLAQSSLNTGAPPEESGKSQNIFKRFFTFVGGIVSFFVGILPGLLFMGVIGLILFFASRSSGGPHSGGGYYSGGGGYSGGGSSGGGGGFGGGSSSGGGSSGGF
jgi:uncharacterized membrane protein YgcG